MTQTSHFELAGERMVIRIIGDVVLFLNLQTNQMSPIEGLQLNKQGVLLEHPDLKDDPEWKQKSMQRFVDKIKSLPSELERTKWMIKELETMKYKYMFTIRDGFRPMKLNDFEQKIQ